MKNRLATLPAILLLLAGLLAGCSSKQTVINGKVTRFTSPEIELYTYAEGQYHLAFKQAINADSSFTFTVDKDSTGFYFVPVPGARKPIYMPFYTTVSEPTEILVSDGEVLTQSKAAKQLMETYEAWDAFKMKYFGREYLAQASSLEASLDELNTAVIGFFGKINTPNEQFNTAMKQIAETDFDLYLVRTYSFSGAEELRMMNQHPVYTSLVHKNFSADVLNVRDAGGLLISTIPSFKQRFLGERADDYLTYALSCFENETLKGYTLLDYATRRKVSGRVLADFKVEYGKYLVTEEQQMSMAAYEQSVAKYAEGQPAFDFTAADTQGQMHQFSELKGKVVLVDVWATWCTPCKAEIPYLEELQETYHQYNDIVFVSLSIDNKPEVWKAFVADKNLKGLQLNIADEAKKNLLDAYDINGVPRFMLFDKNGNIVSISCPRPSGKELKDMIESVL